MNMPRSRKQTTKRFAVLLATYNGEKFLFEQLQSLANQSEAHVDIWLRDHGSKDQTLAIAENFKSQWNKGDFNILQQDSSRFDAERHITGASENFAALIREVETSADYYAFCDQDDIWQPDKLSAARQWLDAQDENTPAMHCSRTAIIDDQGNPISFSPLFRKPPSFQNAIVQNIAGGNTMVVNRAAIVQLKDAFNTHVVIHDWWIYIFVTGLGGNVFYSEDAKTLYRQHSGNLIGENMSVQAKWRRLKMVFSGVYTRWNSVNRSALLPLEDKLTSDARQTLNDFNFICENGGVRGARRLKASGIFRQTRFGQLSLYIACLIGKM